MKKLIILLFLLIIFPRYSESQTQLHGKIVSTNGHPIPGTTILVSNRYEKNIFSEQPDVLVGEDGNYSILFNQEGIYDISIYSIMHPSVRFPLIVSEQKVIDLDVYILPKKVSEGRYFHRDPYRFWIRAYGNFNDFDFHSGAHFSYNEDGSISAEIETDMNPVEYQIRGITQGPDVLPGADDYILRDDKTFAAVIPNPDGKVTITYKPGNITPFERIAPAISNFSTLSYNSFIHFKNPDDKHWVYPVLLSQSHSPRTTLLNSPDDIRFDDVLISNAGFGSTGLFVQRHNEGILNALNNVSSWLENDNLYTQQEFALMIAYIGLVNQALRFNQLLVNNQIKSRENDAIIFEVNPDVARKIVSAVPPNHPLWASAGNVPEILITMLNESDSVINYVEKMARNHPEYDVVRVAYQALISSKAPEYATIEEMPYFNWIIERYGHGSMARSAQRWYVSARPDI
jgi:hypothetical protein